MAGRVPGGKQSPESRQRLLREEEMHPQIRVTVAAVAWLVSCVAALAAPIPTDPNLKLWVRADAGVTTVGDSVTGWADQSDANNDMVVSPNPGFPSTWTAATTPTLVPNQINGKPALLFDAKTDSLQSPTAVVDKANYAVFVVLNSPATTIGDDERTFGANYGAGNQTGVELYVYKQKLRIWQSGAHAGVTAVNDRWVVLELTRSDSGTTMRIDGVLDYSNATPSTTPGTTRKWTIGSMPDNNQAPQPLGLIAEEIIYTYADGASFNAAASSRAAVYDYLHEKYFVAVIPEPASIAGLGLAMLAIVARRPRNPQNPR
jgi:hypothetical protein